MPGARAPCATVLSAARHDRRGARRSYLAGRHGRPGRDGTPARTGGPVADLAVRPDECEPGRVRPGPRRPAAHPLSGVAGLSSQSLRPARSRLYEHGRGATCDPALFTGTDSPALINPRLA